MSLEILYCDAHLVAINKPHGLLVHRTSIARDALEFALQILRDQVGKYVYPCHRLDRKTSGVLLFALDEETNRRLQLQFSEGRVRKKYTAIVRGYTEDNGIIDYPLKRQNGTPQESRTTYFTSDRTEMDVPFSDQPTSRYSLVEIEPQSGRMHQIRKHFAHIYHPIIGDRPYGCNKQNRLFREKWGMTTLMLHASSITFKHPHTQEEVLISASPSIEFMRTKKFLNFNDL